LEKGKREEPVDGCVSKVLAVFEKKDREVATDSMHLSVIVRYKKVERKDSTNGCSCQITRQGF